MIERGLVAIAAVVGGLPFAWLRALGRPLAWLVGSVLRVRRAHVEASARRAGLAGGDVARGVYRALGASVLELLWLSRRPTEALAAVCSLDPASEARLRDALAGGRGVVLAASHTGNWELAACAMARALDLLVVVKPLSVRGVDRFMKNAREKHGLRLAYAGRDGALAPACETLARGGAVAMLVDQVPDVPGHGVEARFLGAPALADRAPAALAACTGAPLVVVAFRRTPAGTHTIRVLEVLQPPTTGRRAWIARATRDATRALDGFVREHPAEWLWLHRRWKLVSGASCTTPSSSPAAPSRAASSSAPASTRTSPRPRTPSTAPGPRSSRSPSGASI